MHRRNVLKALVASLASGPFFAPRPAVALPQGEGKLFPVDLPLRKAAEFAADGFHQPACGVIYCQTQPPRAGVALGGIDTGFLSLETEGTLGSCTLFNSLSPMRAPLSLPFLGMSLKERNVVWLLGSPRAASGEYMWIPIRRIQTPPVIHYWGHYPVADLEYTLPDSPVSVGLRAWSPFLPGDSLTSNTPGAVFEVHLRNVSGTTQQGRLAFMFPGPTQAEAQICLHSPRERRTQPYPHMIALAPTPTRALRQQVRGEEFSGVVVTSEAVKDLGYAIGVIGDMEVHSGGGITPAGNPDAPGSEASDSAWQGGGGWANIGSSLPPVREHNFSSSVAVDFELKPQEQRNVRFLLSWFAPMWIGDGDHTFTHMYAARFSGALEVAQFLGRHHESLLRRVLAWQEVIFAEQSLPVWLREALVNILYLFPVNSLWAQAKPPIGPWCDPKQGLFAMIDGIVEVPAVEPMPDTCYANAPIVYFFPDLALSTLRGYKAYQFTDGAAPWVFGGVIGRARGGFEATAGVEMASPSPGYQVATTGPYYVDMVDRYWLRTGDDAVLKEFYLSVKKNTIFTMSLRHGDGDANIISMPDDDLNPLFDWNDWFGMAPQPGLLLDGFEWTEWFGMAPHAGGMHLANLRMLERMAEKVGDRAFAQQCRDWLTQGSRALESQLWTGSYYLAYYEPKTKRKSDNVFGYQLDGEWMAKFHGLDGVFRPDRVRTTLDTIARTCVRLTPYGATNFARPDGSLAEDVGYGPNTFFVPELYILAMTYMYGGQQKLGLELARRCVQALIDNGTEWNQPNMLRGDNGLEIFGSHYDQNMMLWVLPAALAGKDIASFCAPGGLVDRVIRAAQNG